jgi:hypothetical protein
MKDHCGRYTRSYVFRGSHPGRDICGRFIQRIFPSVGVPAGSKIFMPMFQTVKEIDSGYLMTRANGEVGWGPRRFNGKANAVVVHAEMSMGYGGEAPRFESELRVGDWLCHISYFLPPGDRPRQPAPSGVEQKILWALHLIINGDCIPDASPQVMRRLNQLMQNRRHPIWRHVVNVQIERDGRSSHIEDSMRYGRRYEITREALVADDRHARGMGRVARELQDRWIGEMYRDYVGDT